MHGDTVHIKEIQSEFEKADAVLFAGDFAAFEHEETGLPALKLLCSMHDTIYSVLGNCDNANFLQKLNESDINVQGELVFYNGLFFCGSGGGSKFTGTTPYEREDSELLSDLDCIKPALDGGKCRNLVLICHNPIFNTNTDAVSPTVHVGSPLLRKFIEEVQPVLVVCGHIHESAGIDHIGSTTIVNPGALLEGHYAVANIEKTGDLWQVTSCELF